MKTYLDKLPLLLSLFLGGCATWSKSGPPPRPVTFQRGPNPTYATLVEPAGAAERTLAAARRPAVVLLHSGFDGDNRVTAELAQTFAQRGVLAVVPAYRGEQRALDGQQNPGRVEFCAGEVQDVLGVLAELRARPDVDPQRVAVLGLSHGGCIALRVAARDPRLVAVVTFAGPTDAANTYQYLKDHPAGMFFYASVLRSKLQGYVGAEPEQAPAAWASRSPLREARRLVQPLVLIHGTQDSLVPLQETCRMRDALAQAGWSVTERYFSGGGEPRPLPSPSPCGPVPGAPAAGARPLEVWYFQGQTHVFSQKAMDAAKQRAVQFLLEQLRP